jgi:hypothetical protein
VNVTSALLDDLIFAECFRCMAWPMQATLHIQEIVLS